MDAGNNAARHRQACWGANQGDGPGNAGLIERRNKPTGLSSDLGQGLRLQSTLRLHIHTQEEKKRNVFVFWMRGSAQDSYQRPLDTLTP
jgi:hypothetical protein